MMKALLRVLVLATQYPPGHNLRFLFFVTQYPPGHYDGVDVGTAT